ncbi:adaptin region [Ancylostoma caninum]|uniref:Adaptin region n=1 Tax=Ancylostoma caninum TaxID=29170 RepID=A0A368GH01_ANCCA|nr:adaptin region [Ancylostoma caninum]
MALRKVRSNLDRLFDKSLTDLIRGIRNNKENEARYIASCIEEIKMELRQDSTYIKANAIEKLAYLQMLGYDISWAAFNIIEVMASTKYTEKRIGYLAAAQCFHDTTDVLMLTTNLIRKDLNSSNMYDSGVALGGLSCFVTPDLARDLASDIVNLLSSSRPYTRKRAVLLLYKIFLKYPEALRPTFPRLKDKLEDPDPGDWKAIHFSFHFFNTSVCCMNSLQFVEAKRVLTAILRESPHSYSSLDKVRTQSISIQIQDVTVRVESIRHFSVSQMALLVENAHILLAGSAQQRNNISEVLLAAAWICGEYSQHVRNVPSVLESMLRARTSVMSGHILSVYVQNIGKLYSTLLSKAEEEDDWDAIESLDNLMLSKLADFELAEHLEAQERACTLMSILRVVEAAHARREKIATDIAKLYEGELNPVAPKAQRKVPVPDGLDLDEWINEPWQDTPESSEESDIDSTFGQPAPRIRSEFTSFGCVPTYDDEPKIGEKHKKSKKNETVELSPEEVERRRKAREAERESNPYYVKGTATAPKRPTRFVTMDTAHANDVDKIDIQSPLEIPGVVGLSRYMEQQDSTLTWKKAKEDTKKKKKGKKGKKKRRLSTSSEEEVAVVHQVKLFLSILR